MSNSLSTRSLRRAASFAGALLLLAICAGEAVAGGNSPHVTSIQPAAAFPGDPVDLVGQGLGGPADEYYAWIRTSAAGFVLESPTPSGTGSLGVTVGPVAVAATGTAEVWRGRGHAVPARTVRSGGRLVSARDSRVFVAYQVSSGAPLFSALAASPDTFESTLLGLDLVLDLKGVDTDPPGESRSVRVDVVIETGGSTGSTSNGDGLVSRPGAKRFSSGPRWALHVVVEPDAAFADTATSSATAKLAAALAQVLNDQFGSLGLVATANGSELVLSSVGGIQGGFATVTPGG